MGTIIPCIKERSENKDKNISLNEEACLKVRFLFGA
jgi:hypothetical protein